MTQIEINSNEKVTDFTVLGHCNAGRINGFDLCCCAVSMLVFTAMSALSDMKLCGFKASYSGGWCHIRFDNSSPDTKKAQIALNTVMSGFYMLEKSYPANIHISKKEVAKTK